MRIIFAMVVANDSRSALLLFIFFLTILILTLVIFIYPCYNKHMVIHHDKLAYGKLASPTEEMTEEQIAAMLKQLNDGQEEQDDGEKKKDEK